MLPSDPMILLSYVNTQLRDVYPSLEEFCKSQDVDETYIRKILDRIDYGYDPELNKFV